MNAPTRINKYIGDSGICSKKAADRMVERGEVRINNDRAKVGDKVVDGDCVTINGEVIKPLNFDQTVVVVLNKPVGIVCTAACSDERSVVNFVSYGSRLFPVGRLDKDSQGLLLLTNKGELANSILQSGNQHEKEYRVTVDKVISDNFIAGLSFGVPMLGTTTKRCKVVIESDFVFRIILLQGLNRQIRRMCRHFGYSVKQLERTRIMHIDLHELAVGQWRELTEHERGHLFTMASVPTQ